MTQSGVCLSPFASSVVPDANAEPLESTATGTGVAKNGTFCGEADCAWGKAVSRILFKRNTFRINDLEN